MKLKRRWLLLIIPLALLAWAWQAASWRPKLVGVQPAPPANFWLNRIAQEPPLGEPLLISPDGKLLASSANFNQSNFVMLWDVAARQRQWQIKRTPPIEIGALAFSPDSRLLAVAFNDAGFGRPNYSIHLVETANGKDRPLMKISWQTRLQDATFVSDHELAVVTSESVSIVDVRTGKPIRRWRLKLPAPPNQQLYAPGEIHISADGSTVLALSNRTSNSVVAIYDGATGKQRGKWFYPGLLRNPRLSPDGTLFVLQQETSNLFDVYDTRTGKKLWGAFASSFEGKSWAWSADSQRIWTQSGAGMAVVNARSGADIKSVPVSGDMQALALDPRGDWFYTLDNAGKIWRWRAR